MLREFYNNYIKNLIKTEQEILDRNHQFLPEGKIGELYTAGRVLKRGLVQIPTVSVNVGMGCSLRCKDCDQWNPYLKNSNVKQRSYEDICRIFDALVRHVDYIGRVNIIGGEALIHPDIVKIVRYVAQCKKVGQTLIVTNGTIALSQELIDVCKEYHVLIWVNRYDKSRKWNDVEKACRLNGILITTAISQQWETMGRYGERHNYSRKELVESAEKCFLTMCMGIYGNVLYRCGVCGIIEEEGLGEERKLCKIELCRVRSKLSMMLRLYGMYAATYMEGCRFCVQPKDRKKIRAGVQIGEENEEK